MSTRDVLIDLLAAADGQEINAMDLQTKRFMYGKQADAVLDRFAVVELPTGPTGITYTTEDHEPFPPEELERMAGELLYQARTARKESK